MGRSKYEVLKICTSNAALIWKACRGIAPDSVANKMDEAMLRWMIELTDTLSIWIEKGISMTDGELILAYTNMGSLVESWLKLFYCAYYEDYIKTTNKKKKKVVEPNKLSFNDLKELSVGIIWNDKNDPLFMWVDKIQHYRNAIHSFNYRKLGSAVDFISDLDMFYEYVKVILMRLPPVEDYIEYYPVGYIVNPYLE